VGGGEGAERGEAGGGGGGADGVCGGEGMLLALLRFEKAFSAAWAARLAGGPLVDAGAEDGGGGAGVARSGSGLGPGTGGGGGAEGGVGADAGGGAGAADGLREMGGGSGGALPPRNDGGARGGVTSCDDRADLSGLSENGRPMGFNAGFFRCAARGLSPEGWGGADSAEGGGGGLDAGPVGGLGAAAGGGRGAVLGRSGSEAYCESRPAPVSTPPRFLSLGMPPAKSPPSCGASGRPPPDLLVVSLLLRSRLTAPAPAAAGAGPGGRRPGIAGAPGTAPPLEPLPLSIMAPDLSFVTAFFNPAPFRISPSRAFYLALSQLHFHGVGCR